MQNESSGPQIVRFATFELDVRAGELRKQGVRIKLQEQPLRILEMLLAHPGQLVTREELRARLWPSDSFVDFDHGLNKAIGKLREALGDSADSPRFIETLPKRGYRFTGELGAKTGPITMRSLLILPLENLSRDPEQGYFADGLTEALTTTLAKIRALRVLSRTTAAHYKRLQKTLPQIAQELGVDGIVEGAVLRAEGRVRISAQLLHAPTDTHLWADSYDRDMHDILALQAEVAGAIARQIQVKVTPHEQTQLAHAPAIDPQAYDAYLRGRYLWDKRTPEAIRNAIQSFEEAIARDPNFALAHAGLADCVGVLGFYSYAPPAQACGRAKQLALRTVEMDSNLTEAYTALGWAVQHYDYDFVAAENAYRKAIALDPSNPAAHYRLGISLGFVGRFEEAIAEARVGFSLDPFSVPSASAVAWAHWNAREFDRMIAHCEKAVELHADLPQMHWALAWGHLNMSNFETAVVEMQRAAEVTRHHSTYLSLLAEVYAVAGRHDDAQRALATLLKRSSQQYVSPYMLGRIYAGLGEKDQAFRWLERAYQERAAWTPLLKRDPHLDRLHLDPRFEALVQRMNYPS